MYISVNALILWSSALVLILFVFWGFGYNVGKDLMKREACNNRLARWAVGKTGGPEFSWESRDNIEAVAEARGRKAGP